MSFMLQALAQAQHAYTRGEVPVGAVIIKNNVLVAQASNEVMALSDVTAHAEILVLQKASRLLGTRLLESCDLYVTLEPCPMCAHAISLARIRRLYFGAYDLKGGGVEHGPRIFSHPTCFHRPEIYGGLHEAACSVLLTSFFKERRS